MRHIWDWNQRWSGPSKGRTCLYESGYGCGDGVDPHHTQNDSPPQNHLKLDVYGAEDESGDNLIPNQLRLDRGQARHGVDSPLNA